MSDSLRRPSVGQTVISVLAAGALALLLAGCDQHSADNTLNGVAADTNGAVDRAANQVAERTEAAVANVTEKAQDALDNAKPKAKELAAKAVTGFDKLADATGNAAIKAGHAVSKAGEKTIRSADEAADRAKDKDSPTP
jgi:hypothetical protein